MPTFVMLFFVIIIGIFLFSIFKGISTWSKNEQSPRLSVKAKITGKRANGQTFIAPAATLTNIIILTRPLPTT
ncbi:DUF2500 family protein [Priestia megaterium]